MSAIVGNDTTYDTEKKNPTSHDVADTSAVSGRRVGKTRRHVVKTNCGRHLKRRHFQLRLAAYHPNGRRMINSFDDDEEHDPGQTEREHGMYDRLEETKNFPVADGFVSFTWTFKYLGSHISYNLRDDDNITARIAAANASMGALKELWRNPHLDMYSKYLLF